MNPRTITLVFFCLALLAPAALPAQEDGAPAEPTRADLPPAVAATAERELAGIEDWRIRGIERGERTLYQIRGEAGDWGIVLLVADDGLLLERDDDRREESGLVLEDLPPAARDAVLAVLDGRPLSHLEGDLEEGLVVYLAESDTETESLEVLVTADGLMVEREGLNDSGLRPGDLPEPVRAVIERELAGLALWDIEGEVLEGRVVYTILAETELADAEMEIAADGTVLAREIAGPDEDGKEEE